MNSYRGRWPATGLIALSVFAAGCGGVSEVTKDRVARSETAVRQTQQTIGNSEAGAVELQRARDQLAQAQKALSDNKEEAALRHAQRAELDAELAVAKSQTSSARKAADELLASIQTLRQEAGRSTPEQ
ncbi:MAG: DUF4398 domain-containing protein [Steroidobacter sp.]